MAVLAVSVPYRRYRCFVGARDAGKTTRLLDYCCDFGLVNAVLVVLDAATEHQEKSLIHKLVSPPCHLICVPDVSEIRTDLEIIDVGQRLVSGANVSIEAWFPHFNLMDFIGAMVLFDVSYYLERGHEAEVLSTAKYLRGLFRRQVAQILLKALWQARCLNVRTAIVMDEIELSSAASATLHLFNSMISFRHEIVAAVHSISLLGDAKDLFEIVPLQ